ncbi:hypothetical protein GCM10009117_21450 [Gangjinia marincola]|uniref:Septum formation initiator n=1 Tax=Gangjinia marincola TaxID=578463 RepID=A0ABN1MIH2_9FLAO
MKLKELRQKKWFKVISNKYILMLIIFGTWMFFLDSNNWFIHHELNSEIDDLNKNKLYYLNEISKDEKTLERLEDSVGLERFAREEYYMKRENEDIYIIEYEDSLKQRK